MPSAPAFSELAPGVFGWSVFDAERGLDFNGLFVVTPGGNAIVDPPQLGVAQMDALWARGGVAAIVITNRHHGRRTHELVQRTGAEVWAHESDAPALDLQVDRTFTDGAALPGGMTAIAVPHSKSPGETALLLPRDGGTLIVGDAVIGTPRGALSLLPEPKVPDAAKARDGLRVLLGHAWTRLLVGDGAQPANGREALQALVGAAG